MYIVLLWLTVYECAGGKPCRKSNSRVSPTSSVGVTWSSNSAPKASFVSDFTEPPSKTEMALSTWTRGTTHPVSSRLVLNVVDVGHHVFLRWPGRRYALDPDLDLPPRGSSADATFLCVKGRFMVWGVEEDGRLH